MSSATHQTIGLKKSIFFRLCRCSILSIEYQSEATVCCGVSVPLICVCVCCVSSLFISRCCCVLSVSVSCVCSNISSADVVCRVVSCLNICRHTAAAMSTPSTVLQCNSIICKCRLFRSAAWSRSCIANAVRCAISHSAAVCVSS
jgi:hypothetical protein